MKVICGLGNPGPEYDATRHNVGWWVLDAAHRAWGFPAWVRRGPARLSEGTLGGTDVLLGRADVTDGEADVLVSTTIIESGLDIPSATVRVISDSAHEDLPLDFNTLMTPAQKIHVGKLSWALVRSPWKLAELLAFQQKTVTSAKALSAYLGKVLSAGIPL